jgi:hypothetical protein
MKSNMNPKSIGSVGIKSPKLFEYSSILIEIGVRKAMLKKVHSE